MRFRLPKSIFEGGRLHVLRFSFAFGGHFERYRDVSLFEASRLGQVLFHQWVTFFPLLTLQGCRVPV